MRLLDIADDHFSKKRGNDISKKNTFSQFISQAEVDVIGISISNEGTKIYAIDVAFHEAGLNYNGREETVERVIKKMIRTALCLIGYYGVKDGEIIFASPKIGNNIINDLSPCLEDLSNIFKENRYNFTARVIANEEFKELVMKPILIASEGVSDTTELFMRSYQLTKMFENEPYSLKQRTNRPNKEFVAPTDGFSELKIGRIAQTLLWKTLESGAVSDEEIIKLHKKDYSNRLFGIYFPLLVSEGQEFDRVRYYRTPLVIRGKKYYMCSQWVESFSRKQLATWLKERGFQER